MRIVCLSDTHTLGKQIVVPEGDVLIHAGDLTLRGTQAEVKGALTWLAGLPHRMKLFCAGNHDWFFDPNAPRRFRSWSLYRHYAVSQLLAQFPTLTYLQDSSIVINGVRFFGTPWQPAFQGWAFNLPRNGPQLMERWARIPDDTSVLITHGPPRDILDATPSGEHLGCGQLVERIAHLPKLRLCVFGHIHEGYGTAERAGVTYVNASICDVEYRPVHHPIIVDLG